VHELVRWGAPLMLAEQGTDAFRARWLELPLELMFGGIDPGRPDIQIEVRTADEMLTLTSVAGSVEVRTGPASSPDVVVTGSPELIVGLMSGALDKHVAMSQGGEHPRRFCRCRAVASKRLAHSAYRGPPAQARKDVAQGRRASRWAPRFRLGMTERTHSHD
jgi:hypothetical protein